MKNLIKAICIATTFSMIFSAFAYASNKSTTPEKLECLKIIRTKSGITYTLKAVPKATIIVSYKGKIIKKCKAKNKIKKVFIKQSLLKNKKGKLTFFQKIKNKRSKKTKFSILKIGQAQVINY